MTFCRAFSSHLFHFFSVRGACKFGRVLNLHVMETFSRGNAIGRKVASTRVMTSTILPKMHTEELAETSSPIVDSLEREAAPRLAPISEQSFARAYEKGFQQTVRFLSSRGIPQDLVHDTAQGAWAKAWERRAQLRNPSFVFTWVNSIALNVYRTTLRRERLTESLGETEGPKQYMNAAAIDAERILNECKPSDRIVLEGHYICGYKLDEIAQQNNWSETAARIRLLRARKRMQHLFLASPKECRMRRERVAKGLKATKQQLAA